MASGKWISYLRVSTDRQGASGLGIEAQRSAVTSFLNGGQWELIREFVEVESGGKNDRVQLTEALRMCRLYGAKLVIAKLDRLSRDAHFLLGLEKAGVDFVAADMPQRQPAHHWHHGDGGGGGAPHDTRRIKEALAARGKRLGGKRNGALSDECRQVSTGRRRAVANARAEDILPAIRALQDGGANRTPKASRRRAARTSAAPPKWLVCSGGPPPRIKVVGKRLTKVVGRARAALNSFLHPRVWTMTTEACIAAGWLAIIRS